MDPNAAHQSPSRTRTALCALTGSILFATGLTVVLGVVWKIKQLFENPEGLKIFLALVPEEDKLRTVVVGQENILLPTALFHYGAYGICIVLLLICGMLGGVLLKRGITLLLAA